MSRAARGRQTRAVRDAASPSARSRVLRTVPWLVGATVAVLVGGYVVGRAGGGGTEARAAAAVRAVTAQETAASNAGGGVVRYSGAHHTVYHSSAPLPDARTPAPDARPTLIWFSGTWCEYCEQMEPFAHSTAAALRERVRFVEKSVDHDRSAAARYAVRGTPTFVLIDGGGREIARFFFQPTPQAFTQAIDAALKRAS